MTHFNELFVFLNSIDQRESHGSLSAAPTDVAVATTTTTTTAALQPLRDADQLSDSLKMIFTFDSNLPKLIDDASIPDQPFEKSYVKLQILVNHSSSDSIKKLPIELNNIFDQQEHQSEVSKVLVSGVAGSGKSTLARYAAFHWAKKETSLFAQFNHVFHVPLKMLLDSIIQTELSNLDGSREDMIALLLQRSVEYLISNNHRLADDESSSFSSGLGIVTQIFSASVISSINFDHVLLLLDGYDEIDHLNRGIHIVRDVMMNLLQCKNIVMTTRFNTLSMQMESIFHRKIEIEGFGSNAMEYIRKYFLLQASTLNGDISKFQLEFPKKTNFTDYFRYLTQHPDPSKYYVYLYLDTIEKNKLSSFNNSGNNSCTLEQFKLTVSEFHEDLNNKLVDICDRNESFKDIISTPLNAALFCLVASDVDILDEIQNNSSGSGGSSLGDLYNGVLLWLGKRYIIKNNASERLEEIESTMVLSMPEYKALYKIAFDLYNTQGFSLIGSYIDRLAKSVDSSLTVRKIHQIGLMKTQKKRTMMTSATSTSYELELSFLGKPDLSLLPKDSIKSNKALNHPRRKKLFVYLENSEFHFCYENEGGGDEMCTSSNFNAMLEESLRKRMSIAFGKRRVVILDKNDYDTLIGVLSSLTQFEVTFNPSSSATNKAVKQNVNTGAASTRKEKNESNLLIENHAFIHRSFQEYLTACYIRDLLVSLLSSSEEGGKKQLNNVSEDKNNEDIVQVLGLNRYSHRYQMVLKFLTYLITTNQSNNEKEEEVVNLFWETMICNIDGVLEFSLDMKILLFMCLLPHAKTTKKILDDNGNDEHNMIFPHIQKIADSIDKAVTHNINCYHNDLIASGYSSAMIREFVLSIITLQQQKRRKQDAKNHFSVEFYREFESCLDLSTYRSFYTRSSNTATAAISSPAEDVFQSYMNLLDHSDIRILRSTFITMSKFIRSSPHLVISDEIINQQIIGKIC